MRYGILFNLLLRPWVVMQSCRMTMLDLIELISLMTLFNTRESSGRSDTLIHLILLLSNTSGTSLDGKCYLTTLPVDVAQLILFLIHTHIYEKWSLGLIQFIYQMESAAQTNSCSNNFLALLFGGRERS